MPKRRIPKPLTNSQRAVAECNLKLAVYLADRYAKAYGYDPEELRSVAFVALTEAASRYDPRMSMPGRYFGVRIHGDIRDWIRARDKDRKRLPTQALRKGDATIADHTADIADEDEADFLLKWIDPRAKRLLKSTCYEGLSYKQAAAEIGISKSRVTKIVAETSRKIRLASRYDPKK